MPNQNQSNQDQKDTKLDDVFSTNQTDLPPMPSAFQNLDGDQTSGGSSTTQPAPVSDTNDINNVISSPKKKFGTKRIIATVLGILALVGGVGAGVFLIDQKQLFKQEAAYNLEDCNSSNCDGECRYDGSSMRCFPKSTCQLGATECVYDNDIGASFCGGYGAEKIYKCYNVKAEQGQRITGTTNCVCPSGNNPAPGGYCLTSTSCSYNGNGTRCTNDLCSTTTPVTEPPTETNPPTSTAYCSTVSTYSSSWELISPSNRSSLTEGDVVYLCVSGYASSGSYDKARFIINGSLQEETTLQRSGSSDFCQSYTIPGGTTTFNISGQVHHSTLGWF